MKKSKPPPKTGFLPLHNKLPIPPPLSSTTIISIILFIFVLFLPPTNLFRIGVITNVNQASNTYNRILDGVKLATKNNIKVESFSISMRSVTRCNGMTGMTEALTLILNQSVNVIFGGLCSENCKATAQAANYWNLPYFPLNCFDSTMDDTSIYTTVIRLFGSLSGFGSAFRTLFMYYTWNVAGVLTEGDGGFCSFAITSVRRRFREQHISIDTYLEMPTVLDGSEVLALEKLKSSARIIFLCHSNYTVMRNLIFRAQSMGMTNPREYVWLIFYNIYSDFPFNMLFEPWDEDAAVTTAPQETTTAGMKLNSGTLKFDTSLFAKLTSWQSEDPYSLNDTDLHSMRDVERRKRSVAPVEKDALKEYRKKAFQSVKILTYKNFSVLPEVKESRTKFNLFDYITDITFLYLKLRDMVIDWGEDPLDGTSILNATKSVAISGYTQQIRFNKNADRIMSFMVWQLPENAATFRPYLEINLSIYDNYTAHLISKEWWGTSTTVPLDVPVCGFENELCSENMETTAIGLSVGCIGLVCLIAIAIAWRISNKEHKIYKMSWRIDYNDLEFLTKSRSSSRTFENFDTAEDHKVVYESFKKMQVPSGILRAMYKGSVVSVHYSNKKDIRLSRKELIELSSMKDLQHDNLVSFMGACLENDRVCYLTAYCSRGSLQDIICDTDVKLDWSFKVSFITDIAKGMQYIHKSFLNSHGRLNSHHCLVDNRWVMKICNFGMDFIKKHQHDDENKRIQNLLWTAPELLRNIHPYPGTQKGDVFSFAIIMHEIVFRLYPYQLTNLSEKEIVTRVREYSQGVPLRPSMVAQEGVEVHPTIGNLILQCWEEEPGNRPTFESINKQLQKDLSNKNESLVDSMLDKLEKYANNLEGIVQQRTEELVEEKRKTDGLLHSMLPPFIADELKAGHRVEPKMYQAASLYFSDIVGFTTLSSQSTPMQIVDLLNDLYGAFDDTISKHNVYKVETIGDAYMVVSGLPKVTNTHVLEICNLALDLLSIVKTFKIRHRPEMMLMLRIGIHSGPCAAGVVGHRMPRYCLFGDTVNTASRMESTGEALKIHVSTPTHDELLKYPEYVLELRGPVELKGKGKMTTYWLLRKEEKSE